MRIVLAVFLLISSIFIPLYFEELLEFFTLHLNSGWVFGSIYLRLLVIILFSISLYLIFSLFERTRKIKFIIVFLIALLPGFGISFIAPIYNVDYGMLDDERTLGNLDTLSHATDQAYSFNQERSVLAFFTTGCPHCKAAAKKLATNLRAGQQIDVHAFFPSSREKIDAFLAQNNAENINSYSINNRANFVSFSGNNYPSIYIIDADGSTLKHFSGDMINYTLLDYLLELRP